MCTYNRTVFACNHSYLHTLVRSCLADGAECGTGVWHGLHSRKVAVPCLKCINRQIKRDLLREGMLRCRQVLDRWVPGDVLAELDIEAELDSLEALSEADGEGEDEAGVDGCDGKKEEEGNKKADGSEKSVSPGASA